MAHHPDKLFMSSEDPVTRAATLDAMCEEAMSCQLNGNLQRAAQIYRAVLDTQPQHAAANYCIGMLFLTAKQPTEGLPNLLAALTTAPQVPDYWLGVLEALLLADRLDEATNTLALARQHGLTGRCATDFAQRLSVKMSALANRLESQMLRQVQERQFTDAQSSARQLTRRFLDRGLGWKVLGALLAADGDPDEALCAMQQAVRLLPTDAEALCNLGATLNERGQFEKAEACLQKAIAVDPQFDGAYVHLGFACVSLEKYPQAEAMYRKAVAVWKQSSNFTNDMRRHSSLLFLLSHNPALDAAGLFAEHLAIGGLLESQRQRGRPHFFNERQPERRLKLGFVSGDFRNHALANFLEPILEKLRDHTDLELHAYYNYPVEDDTSRRLRQWFRTWHSVIGLSDVQLVELIETNRIDILIDLSSHTSFNRLGAFAMKAAPLQASWMGYPGTTGLRTMDYYLSDRCFLPPGQFDTSFTEKIVYLPASASFKPDVESPAISELPALQSGFITFGSFNRLGKLNPFTVRLWCRLLREVPHSILILAAIPSGDRRDALVELFNAEGIAAERIAFFPRSDMPTYLALHNQVDMCLDTFPYPGGTTTSHALWMGVPTLTLTGQTPASRQGAAILVSLGLEGFIAENPDDFIRKGVHWSTALALLSDLRCGLRERWRNSPSRQPEVITDAFAVAVRHMWRRWCANLPCESFHTTAVSSDS